MTDRDSGAEMSLPLILSVISGLVGSVIGSTNKERLELVQCPGKSRQKTGNDGNLLLASEPSDKGSRVYVWCSTVSFGLLDR